MRVVYDYGLPLGGRNRYHPPPLLGLESSQVDLGRGAQTAIIISRSDGEATDTPVRPSSVPTSALESAPLGGTSAGEHGYGAEPALRGELSRHARDQLRNHSRAIRLHEQAHLAVLGGLAAGPVQYQSERAADGTSYLTGGRIKVDLSPVPGDPRATLRKARAIQQAAHAPGDSSPTDMATAAKAYRLQMEAMEELKREHAGEEGVSIGFSGS